MGDEGNKSPTNLPSPATLPPPSQISNITSEDINERVKFIIKKLKEQIKDTAGDEVYDLTKDPLSKEFYSELKPKLYKDKSQTYYFTMPPDNQLKKLYRNLTNYIYLGISKIFNNNGDENIPIVLKIKNSDTDIFSSLIVKVVEECVKNYKVVYLSFSLSELDDKVFNYFRKDDNFKLHHLSKKNDDRSNDSIVLFKDRNTYLDGHPKQVVQSYATSIQGINIYIITKDNYILSALERGNIKGVSGAVDEGDNIIKTINKELEEEIGFKLDQYNIYFLSGHIINKARDNLIADNFHSFVIKVNNTANEILETFDQRLDKEITGIGFFKINELLNGVYNNVYFNTSEFMLPNNHIKSRFFKNLGSFLNNEGSVLKTNISDDGEEIKILNDVEKLLPRRNFLPHNMGEVDIKEARTVVNNLRGGKLKRKPTKRRRHTKKKKTNKKKKIN